MTHFVSSVYLRLCAVVYVQQLHARTEERGEREGERERGGHFTFLNASRLCVCWKRQQYSVLAVDDRIP